LTAHCLNIVGQQSDYRNEMQNTDRKKLIQQYYSARAKDYDRQKGRTWKNSRGFGTDVINEVLEAFKDDDKKRVLEVGVGSGRNALPLLQETKPWLVGLDLSKEMLTVAKHKMSTFKNNVDLILGDAEHLPFNDRTFDAMVCMSTMHYFKSQKESLKEFSKKLKENGTFVYGELTLHEGDGEGFFETLERTLSRAHTKYSRPSEMRMLMEANGFHVSKIKTFAYNKSYAALIEDKGQYFDVKLETLFKQIEAASMSAREQYSLTSTELTQFYTVIKTTRKRAA
jgi:ubiquinone/menaquinone biosynthesis C-methylase UbiE